MAEWKGKDGKVYNTKSEAQAVSQVANQVANQQAFVSKQFLVKGKEVDTPQSDPELLGVHLFQTEPARVAVEMGMTINLGNFESVRISVSLTVPCYSEEKDAAFDYAKKWVEKRTLAEANEARKFAGARHNTF
jgi:hypothetical protein